MVNARNSALAIGLVAAVGLLAAPNTADPKSIQRDGYFGGTWSPIGPRNNRHVQRYHRKWAPRAYAYYGSPGYYYGPSYYYGPGYYGRGGISFGFGF